MFDLLVNWYKRRFSDPEAIALLIILLGIFGVIYFFHRILSPLLIAIVLAYILEWPVQKLIHWGMSRTWATTLILFLFCGLFIVVFLFLLPIAWQQRINFYTDFPNMVNKGYQFLIDLPKEFPDFVDAKMVDTIANEARNSTLGIANSLLQLSVDSLKSILTIAIYFILVPMIAFFLLKDKEQMFASLLRILPKNRRLAGKVWIEMNQQISNYIRGKAAEIFIVTVATYVVFFYFHLNYSLLLAVCVGISVVIPYIGAVIVTIPVFLVAWFQWGNSSDLVWMFSFYILVQGLDGNVLVPLLFSEAVNLHPLVIIMSVVIFAGLWGFWGGLFAIPLATLIKAVVNVWPDATKEEELIKIK